MKTRTYFLNTVPYKKFIVTFYPKHIYKVIGFIKVNGIWKQFMDHLLNSDQFCKISQRIPLPKICNPNCQL